ncbi:ricin B lectin [Paenibacillus massiliensis]|uniref:pectate lyase family protein n=1 Tax=Paenibacillus massiliensis TaxID=225917 RepID=UPI0004721ACD|nr:ricin B lectin [Paenibacillus massiliensis]
MIWGNKIKKLACAATTLALVLSLGSTSLTNAAELEVETVNTDQFSSSVIDATYGEIPALTEDMLLTSLAAANSSEYGVAGFAAGTTGGGVVAESNSKYIQVYNATDLAKALKKGSGYKVVEIMNDLDLGWNEIPSAAKNSAFAQYATPLTHPVLKKTGVSKISIDGFNGLTIFSSNGAKIKHAGFTLKRSQNVIIRNLEFDELWEWDEATKGDYDRNDWDYINIEESHKIWIDHCTFNKAYDGLVDVKKGSTGVTISWSAFLGDNGNSNSWVNQQIKELEASRSKYPMYNLLRSQGLSTKDIAAVAASQKKGHLVGANEFASDNKDLQVTLHHNYYKDVQDRMPRLRGGNVHAYNIVMDNGNAWQAKKLITSKIDKALADKGFHFGVTSNGAISTEGGSVLVEKSVINDVSSPVRNNQKDAKKSNYTGKIQVLDTIYTMNGVTFRGGSEDSKSPLSPVPASAIKFAWTGFSKLPYSYTPDDPSKLKSRLISSSGAGAGKLNWKGSQWLDAK